MAATIKGPPIASQRNLQLLARLGDEVKLVCPMEGNPAPIIEWSKGDQMVDYQMTRYRTSKKSLRIRDVDKTDSGRFTCKGINGFGKEEIKIDLIIIDPVDFPGLPEGALPEVTPPALTSDTLTARTRFSKKPEETLRISCGALGKPKPVVTWYKNGHELLENVREKHGKSVLHVRGLMVRDSGRYTCVARNMVGEASKNFTVEVEDEGTEPPNFSHAPMNRTVREGEAATFDCRVRSYSRPHIKWLKKVEASDTGFNLSEVIPVGSDKYRLIHTSREIPLTSEGEILSQLLLRGVNRGDAGMYVCFVTSPRGGFNYRPAYLTVIPRTESLVNESPPVLILVICLSVVVLGILIAIIACVVRRRTKEPISPPDSAEVRHSLMPSLPTDATSLPYSKASEPASYSKSSELGGGGFSSKTSELPPPPPPSQWSHLYSASCTSSSHYEGPTYEVPHTHGGKTPAPSLRYGYSGSHAPYGNHINGGPTYGGHASGGPPYAGYPVPGVHYPGPPVYFPDRPNA